MYNLSESEYRELDEAKQGYRHVIKVSLHDDEEVLFAMAERHNVDETVTNTYYMTMYFIREQDYLNFAVEAHAYEEQQEFLEMNTDDTGLNLGPISPNGVPDFGDLYINMKPQDLPQGFRDLVAKYTHSCEECGVCLPSTEWPEDEPCPVCYPFEEGEL